MAICVQPASRTWEYSDTREHQRRELFEKDLVVFLPKSFNFLYRLARSGVSPDIELSTGDLFSRIRDSSQNSGWYLPPSLSRGSATVCVSKPRRGLKLMNVVQSRSKMAPQCLRGHGVASRPLLRPVCRRAVPFRQPITAGC